jgi:hypothetical protein
VLGVRCPSCSCPAPFGSSGGWSCCLVSDAPAAHVVGSSPADRVDRFVLGVRCPSCSCRALLSSIPCGLGPYRELPAVMDFTPDGSDSPAVRHRFAPLGAPISPDRVCMAGPESDAPAGRHCPFPSRRSITARWPDRPGLLARRPGLLADHRGDLWHESKGVQARRIVIRVPGVRYRTTNRVHLCSPVLSSGALLHE